MVEIGRLMELPGNVNAMSDAEFNELVAGIEQSKLVPALVVAPRGEKFVILDGNHRYRAAKLLGYAQLACHILDDLTNVELQEVLAARIAIVRGSPQREKVTPLWFRLCERMDQTAAMRTLGITSEKQLRGLVTATKRRIDVPKMQHEAVEALMGRAKAVEDLATIVRAAIGDGGVGEFEYLVFQVRGSKLLLVRLTAEQFAEIERAARAMAERQIAPAAGIVQALAAWSG